MQANNCEMIKPNLVFFRSHIDQYDQVKSYEAGASSTISNVNGHHAALKNKS